MGAIAPTPPANDRTDRQRVDAAGIQPHCFASMGTWVECLVEAPHSAPLRAAFAHVEHEFGRLERKLSRFRADSELSRLNRERAIEASDELLELATVAIQARELTGGRFDPTLHDALVAAGYDRTFRDLADDAEAARAAASGGGDVVIRGRRIELGTGAALDLGGIAKGWAADRCAALLAAHGPALVNAGGDLAVSGPRADGGPWPVGVELPQGRLTLAVARGGLATSGRDRRRWRRGGEERHHLIDPRTLRPAETAHLSVTVAAGSATDAEVAAKALFLARDPEREAKLAGTAAVIVQVDGGARLVGIGAEERRPLEAAA
jgi:thiamine biosynthesis lipoprotein